MFLEIKELKDGMKRIDLRAHVVEKGDARQVQSRFSDEGYEVADATIADETGSIKLVLWNEQIERVKVGDTIAVKNGYVTTFKGEIQLNVGKYGTLEIIM